MEKLSEDVLWALRKRQANKIAELYSSMGCTDEWYKIKNCATQLKFIYGYPEYEGAPIPQRLVAANFCRLRHCPICQWRRSVRWQAKAFQALPKIFVKYPTARWLFLTLTVKNCPLAELRSHINKMNAAFSKWTQQDYWYPSGWVRSLEITRGADDSVHPHFHVLMLVPPSYFSRNYLSQNAWSMMWAKHMNLDYLPIVHVKAIPPQQIEKSIPEIAKYQCKPQDLIDEDGQWLFELTCQLKNSRGINVGGNLKEFFRGKEQSEEDDLIGKNIHQIHTSPISSFWHWGKTEESATYQNDFFFGNCPISHELAVDQFMSWAGV